MCVVTELKYLILLPVSSVSEKVEWKWGKDSPLLDTQFKYKLLDILN